MKHDYPKRSLNRIDSFRHAFAGLFYMLRTQRNAWVHTAATVGVVSLGLWLRLDALSWSSLALAIGLVWASEFVNTALEAVVDLASPGIHPMARVGKDVAAAAVLVGAITSVIVGLLVLGPPLWDRLIR
jgi:diacylglycerol kinase (ATP)